VLFDAVATLQASTQTKKQAFKRFALRWHPDKFLQRFGGRFEVTPAREQAVVMGRVTALFQRVCGAVR
jgi:hypothetical protein